MNESNKTKGNAKQKKRQGERVRKRAKKNSWHKCVPLLVLLTVRFRLTFRHVLAYLIHPARLL